jgi:sulfonate transport system substrate-binding protein
LFVTTAFEQAHPQDTAKVVLGFVNAARFAADEANRQTDFDVWAKSGLPVESFEADFSGERLAHRISPLIDAYIVTRYKEQAQRAKLYGLIRKDIDVESWFQPKYLNAALAELKLEHFWPTYDARGAQLTTGQVELTQTAGN